MVDELKINKYTWDEFTKRHNPLFISAVKSFNHGLDHYSQRYQEDNRRFCFIEIDQAIELLLKAILLEKGVKVTGLYLNYEKLLSECKKNNVHIPKKSKLRLLRDNRNLVQHEGKVPDIAHTEFFVNIAAQVLLELVKKEFGIKHSEIVSLVPMLPFLNIKRLKLNPPEKPKILESMETIAYALFLYECTEISFNKIVQAINEILAIIYEKKSGKVLSPATLKELDDIDVDLGKKINLLKSVGALAILKVSEIPFDFKIPVKMVPQSLIGLKICTIMREKRWLDGKTCDFFDGLLATDLLRHDEELKEKINAKLSNKVLVKLFYLLRHLIFTHPEIKEIIEKYREDEKRYFDKLFEYGTH
jgi:HEPN domain-containing protein